MAWYIENPDMVAGVGGAVAVREGGRSSASRSLGDILGAQGAIQGWHIKRETSARVCGT